RVGVMDIVRSTVRRQMHANPPRSPYAGAGIYDFHEKTRPVLDASAITVLTLIGAVLQKLIDQVAIGRVDLDTVESCVARMSGRIGEVLDNVRDFFRMQRPRHHVVAFGAQKTDMPGARNGAGGDGDFSVQVFGVGYATDMPQLDEDLAALLVNCRCDLAPAVDLGRRPDSRCIGITDALRRHGSRFAQDQPSARTLAVI